MAGMDLPQGWTWDDVLTRLGEHVDVDESARQHGAIKRMRAIRTGTQLLRLVLAYALSGLSLRSTSARAEAMARDGNRGAGLSPLGRRRSISLWRFIAFIACRIRCAVLAGPDPNLQSSHKVLHRLAEPPRRRQNLATLS
jgi:hypothetical protein